MTMMTRRRLPPSHRSSPRPRSPAAWARATPPPTSRALDKNQKDELTWLVWSSDTTTRKDAYDAMAQRLTEQFPNVTITRVPGNAETMEKLVTMIASDTRVDVVGTRPDYLAAYVEGINPLKSLRDIPRRTAV